MIRGSTNEISQMPADVPVRIRCFLVLRVFARSAVIDRAICTTRSLHDESERAAQTNGRPIKTPSDSRANFRRPAITKRPDRGPPPIASVYISHLK